MRVYAVVMAGGQGSRFWPLSREGMPKHVLNIIGNDIMLNATIKRLLEVISIENILVIANSKQKDTVSQLILSDLPRENILFEPCAKDTAACIAYAAMVIRSRCEEAVMCVFPADHYIADQEEYARTVKTTCAVAAETGRITTVGVKPRFPATGYGYIRHEKECFLYDGVHEVKEFVEKPGIEDARKYVEESCTLWNAGIFAWKVSTILNSLKRYLPKFFEAMSKVAGHIGAKDEKEALDAAYAGIQSISIDYAVLERSDDILVVEGGFGWNDIGSWDALDEIFTADEDGNIIRARHIGIETRNSIICGGDRLIATIGLDGFIVVDSKDALLICPKGKAQEVKKLVDIMKENEMKEYL